MGLKYGNMETFVKELSMKEDLVDKERQELHMIRGKYYVVSRILARDHGGWETLVFKSNKDGNVLNWLEEYGYIGYEPIHESVRKFQELQYERNNKPYSKDIVD